MSAAYGLCPMEWMNVAVRLYWKGQRGPSRCEMITNRLIINISMRLLYWSEYFVHFNDKERKSHSWKIENVCVKSVHLIKGCEGSQNTAQILHLNTVHFHGELYKAQSNMTQSIKDTHISANFSSKYRLWLLICESTMHYPLLNHIKDFFIWQILFMLSESKWIYSIRTRGRPFKTQFNVLSYLLPIIIIHLFSELSFVEAHNYIQYGARAEMLRSNECKRKHKQNVFIVQFVCLFRSLTILQR